MRQPSSRPVQIQTTSILVLLLALVDSIDSWWTAAGAVSTRHKRDILQLCELVSIHTNRACWDYNNYGCFCGLGSADSQPLDAVDKCCRAHDRCYGRAGCFWLYPHFVGYSFECTAPGCKCTDSPTSSPCRYSTCKCDLKLARCLARSEFNIHFRNYDRETCKKPQGQRNRGNKKSPKKKRERKNKTWSS